MASTERRASPPTSSGSSKQQHGLCDQTTVQQPAGSTLNLLFCFCSRNYRGFDKTMNLSDEVDLAVYIMSTDPRCTSLMILTAFIRG